jgi:hypothetical protein
MFHRPGRGLCAALGPPDRRIGRCGAVCAPYFTRLLSEISLAEVIVKLFRTVRRYEPPCHRG